MVRCGFENGHQKGHVYKRDWNQKMLIALGSVADIFVHCWIWEIAATRGEVMEYLSSACINSLLSIEWQLESII